VAVDSNGERIHSPEGTLRPKPDLYLAACRALGAAPSRTPPPAFRPRIAPVCSPSPSTRPSDHHGPR
jgi:hypothetical protein